MLLTRAAFLLALVAIALPARTSAAVDDQPTTPTRIISCAPSLTEMLFALGAGDTVIGVTRYCEFPEEAKKLPKYGDLYNPSLEAMVAARPDLIVALPGNERLRRYFADKPGVRLFETKSTPETIAEIAATMIELGRAIGREKQAHELIAHTNNTLAALREQHAGRPRPRVMIVVGREQGSLANLYAVGKPTYLTELLDIIGADNVVADEKLGKYPVLSREAILRLNPDIIIETHHAADTPETRAEMRKAWQALPAVAALRNDRLLILTDKHVLLPGPFLERDAAALARMVHP